MQRSSNAFCTLVGALVLNAGFATPLTLADEPEQTAASSSAQTEEPKKPDSTEQDQKAAESTRPDGDTVEVRISLPDGRTIIRLEPKTTMSARYKPRRSTAISTSRSLPDGSRISVATRGVRGGSNIASVRTGGGGGGGGGGSTTSGGGGGGGGGAGGGAASVVSADAGVETKARSSGGGVFSYGPPREERVKEAEEEVASGSQTIVVTNGQTESDSSSDSDTQSGTQNQSDSQADPQASDRDDAQTSTQSDTLGADQTDDQSNTPSVPTIGDPIIDDEGDATGGQSIKFDAEGMAATVIGNRVYFRGVEIVTSNRSFTVITGTRVASDSVILDPSRAQSTDSGESVTSSSGIVLEFASGSVIDLMMFSRSADPNQPNRVERTWTIRIR